MSNITVVIMAGGKGTRIQSIDNTVPKPMIKIEDKPVLEYEIKCLKKQGFTNFIITVSYMSETIIDYFKDGSKFGVNIEYYNEITPLGNAGALFKIYDKLSDDFILINADSLFDVDFNRFYEFHKKKNAFATLLTHPNNHPFDSGLIIADKNNAVLKWLTKEDNRPQYYKNRVNSGIHLINKQLLNLYDGSKVGTYDINNKIIKIDLDRDLLKPLAGKNKIYCYDSSEYVRDMGTPDRFKRVIKDLKSKIIFKRNLKNKQKAIFLDRDGTINKYVGFLTNINQFELINGVSDAIKRINNSEFLCIVITNQPVIARGEVTFDELDEIHNKMETLLGNDGAFIDGIYYCPHHPDSGFEGEIKELKIKCECRKPKPGLILKAQKDFNIDLKSSWMIGDDKNDILAGINAGCKTALIGNGDYGENLKSNNLLDIINKIIGEE